MTFSDRMGITEARSVMQVDGIDKRLRTALFNCFYRFIHSAPDSVVTCFMTAVWGDFWCKPIDDCPSRPTWFDEPLKNFLFEAPWYEVYNFIEFTLDEEVSGYWLDTNEVNRILESEMSGYRVICGEVVPITDEMELAALAEALEVDAAYSGARMHVQKAIAFLSLKPEPDLGNAVKEAISAVESAAKVVAGNENADLGKALVVLKKTGTATHPALLEAWQKMYAFAGDEKGIRHASVDGSVNVDFTLAKYMVVTSAAFVNYLVAEQANRQ